ncbi:MAG TPA: hypothetical protein VKA81_07405 [Verrucomicrobiae bacterium]|nr:hypothetical protein [Verrucomicrobiae bacterium]
MPCCFWDNRDVRILPALLLAAPLAVQSAIVTFNQQIAPIIYRNCSACHRPGEAAPFALLSYADVVTRMQSDPTLAKKVAQLLAE